ncbi:MAG: SdiA-regulated family protein, partial [Chitinophagaceae bacterium]|nr:SdiA-regulated family protein [Chitinophagaceae bacterium]
MTRYFAMMLLICLIGCGPKKNKQHAPKDASDTMMGPYSYDLNVPEKFYMPDALHEISGITFNHDNDDTLYAEQDEDGKLFHFKLGDKNLLASKFGKKGDYEDVAICNGYVIMLRSDGTLFSFLLSEANHEKVANVQALEGLLPDGEFEGLYADEKTSRLYVLCKHCQEDKTSKISSGTILQLNTDGKITPSGNFSVNVKEIEALANIDKISFHPSALAKSPATGEWYILSSVNKMLVVTDESWNPKTVYPLNPSIFNQPEGIAFDRNNNLYISNEGG